MSRFRDVRILTVAYCPWVDPRVTARVGCSCQPVVAPSDRFGQPMTGSLIPRWHGGLRTGRSRGNAGLFGHAGPRPPEDSNRPFQVQPFAAPSRRGGVPIDVHAGCRQLRRTVGSNGKPVQFGADGTAGSGRPSGRTNAAAPLGSTVTLESRLVNCPVMPPAEQHQIVERGRPAMRPVPNVMGIAAAGLASRKAALPVARRPERGAGQGISCGTCGRRRAPARPDHAASRRWRRRRPAAVRLRLRRECRPLLPALPADSQPRRRSC